MPSITFTRKHILEALAIKGHVHRKWLEVLPPYAYENTRERQGRRYNGRDLIFFLIVQFLIEHYGMSLDIIARFSQNLARFLDKPLSMSATGYLVINIDMGEIKVAQTGLTVEPSIIMPLETPLKRYRAYLGHDIDEPKQSTLPFAFKMLNNRKRG
ncbi:MAG: hypothetical protein M1547_02935 [Gammaproteobacteria bacterium]|nr:hypothetical protein [Gammaproteobacteria bacterium]